MHIEILIHASPEKHKRFTEEINNWKYPVQEKIRNGFHAPFISEWKVYDIRVPEIIAGRFIRDLKARFTQKNDENKEKQSQGTNIIYFLIKIARKIMGLETVKMAEGPTEFKLTDWYNAYLIGSKKDPIQNNYFREKEVL